MGLRACNLHRNTAVCDGICSHGNQDLCVVNVLDRSENAQQVFMYGGTW